MRKMVLWLSVALSVLAVSPLAQSCSMSVSLPRIPCGKTISSCADTLSVFNQLYTAGSTMEECESYGCCWSSESVRMWQFGYHGQLID